MLLGFRPIGYVEWDDYCQRVIAARIRDGILPDAPIFGDIKTFISDGYAASYTGLVDVVTGGFPCQSFSVQNSRTTNRGENEQGGADHRNMWPSTKEVIRLVRPEWCLLENVPGLIASRNFGTILGDLAQIGYCVRWRCISSAEIGAQHIRERVWIVAHSTRFGHVHQTHDKGKHPKILRCGTRPHIKIAVPFTDEWMELVRNNEPLRSNDGVDSIMDRIKAVGNGQDPYVVATAWRILTGGEYDTDHFGFLVPSESIQTTKPKLSAIPAPCPIPSRYEF
jgi:DNA (cytosine-5)-methyltransferase 1